jgi:protein gp37
MSDKSAIEWTDATWNPVTGCSKVSPGCAHCYAETLSLRFGWSKRPWLPEYAPENVVLHPERLDQPLRWRQPRRVFVNSMSDLFHELVPDAFVHAVFERMARANWHSYQILTKRPERMARVVEAFYTDRPGQRPLRHVWLGTSIENDRWTSRADALRETPAAVRFVSAEPLLGPLPSLDLTDIDWLIVGGESGAGARPMDPAWARQLRDHARATETAFFFKQWGGRTPKARGRELDGRTWDEFPEPQGLRWPEAALPDLIGRAQGLSPELNASGSSREHDQVVHHDVLPVPNRNPVRVSIEVAEAL